MISYGDAIAWCMQHEAVIRFVNRDMRREIFETIRTPIAMEMAVEIDGHTKAAHYPLDVTLGPVRSVALAMIGCVNYFIEEKARLVELVTVQ